jgi:hypothetical protein
MPETILEYLAILVGLMLIIGSTIFHKNARRYNRLIVLSAGILLVYFSIDRIMSYPK